MYHLGKEYLGVSFTKREVDCLIPLLFGHSIIDTAKILQLSLETVQFYIKNMCKKIGVVGEEELIVAMRDFRFISGWDDQAFDPAALELDAE